MEQGYQVITGRDAIQMAVKGTYLVKFDVDNWYTLPFEVVGLDANGLHCLETSVTFRELDFFSVQKFMSDLEPFEKHSTWLQTDVCNVEDQTMYRLLKPANGSYNECWHPSVKRGAHVFAVKEGTSGYAPLTYNIVDILSYHVTVQRAGSSYQYTFNILDFDKTWFTDYQKCMAECNRLTEAVRVSKAVESTDTNKTARIEAMLRHIDDTARYNIDNLASLISEASYSDDSVLCNAILEALKSML